MGWRRQRARTSRILLQGIFFYSNSRPNSLPIKPDGPISQQNLIVTKEELVHALMVMNKSAAPGSDHIHTSFISNSSSNLIYLFLSTFLSNSSLQSGVFPERLKPSYIRPTHSTHKTGCTNNVENYRPITTSYTQGQQYQT